MLLATYSDKNIIPRKDKQTWTVYEVHSSRVFPASSTAHVRTFLPNPLRVYLQACHPWIYVIFFWAVEFCLPSQPPVVKNHRNSSPFLWQDTLSNFFYLLIVKIALEVLVFWQLFTMLLVFVIHHLHNFINPTSFCLYQVFICNQISLLLRLLSDLNASGTAAEIIQLWQLHTSGFCMENPNIFPAYLG